MIYADASFLVSLYLRDVHSDAAVSWVLRNKAPLSLTGLQRHELRNALRLAVYRSKGSPGLVTRAAAAAALHQVDADLAAGNLVELTLPWSDAIEAAERIGALHTMDQGVRGMDLLNVAAALALGARRFLTFDERQACVARLAGLPVVRFPFSRARD